VLIVSHHPRDIPCKKTTTIYLNLSKLRQKYCRSLVFPDTVYIAVSLGFTIPTQRSLSAATRAIPRTPPYNINATLLILHLLFFLPRDVMQARPMLSCGVCLCLSVCLSRSYGTFCQNE